MQHNYNVNSQYCASVQKCSSTYFGRGFGLTDLNTVGAWIEGHPELAHGMEPGLGRPTQTLYHDGFRAIQNSFTLWEKVWVDRPKHSHSQIKTTKIRVGVWVD